MKCINCDKDAHAVCQFCGRAVCRNHFREAEFLSGYSRLMGMWGPAQSAIRVENAVWCGICSIHHDGKPGSP